MMKRLWVLALVLTVSLVFTACGDSYDENIDSVVNLENEELEKDSVDTDLDSLSRDDLEKVNVYNEGEYIELLYVIRGSSDTTNPVYKYDEDTSEYVRYNNGDFMADEIDGLEADYSEPEDDGN